MGAYDDLVPQQTGGTYDDLIPQGQPQLPTAPTYPQRRVGGKGGSVLVTDERYAPELAGSEGAPMNVRAMVGNSPPQDRLANLQRYYPEAQPYGRDNFIFVNPKTNKWELYNPEGLDVGDVPSVGRDIVTGTGATLAGLAAAGASTAATAGTAGAAAPSYVTVPAAAGTGAAVAGETFDALNRLAGQIDTREIGQRFKDVINDFLFNAVPEVAGPIIAAAPRNLATGAKAAMGGGDAAAQRLSAAKAAGVEPTAGMVSESRMLHNAEATLGALPGSADVIQSKAQAAVDQMKGAAEDLASKYSGNKPVTKSQELVGETVQVGAKEGAERMKQQYGRLYEQAYDMVGKNLPIDVTSLQRLRAEFASTLGQAEGSLKPNYGAAINEIDTILKDAAKNNGALPLDALRRIRTKIGQELDRPVLTSESPGGLEALRKRTYAELTAAIDQGVAAANPQAGRVLAQANKLTEAYKRVREPFLKQVAAAKTPEQAFNLAMSGAKDGGTRLAKLRKSYTPEQWDEIAGHVLYQLGRAKPSAQNAASDVFSPSTFLTNWADQSLSPGAKAQLFSGQRYAELRPALDRLAKVVEGAKQVEKQTNISGTGRMAAYSILFSGALAAPFSKTAAGLVVVPVVSSYASAKLMTNPKFVNWLASSLADTSFKPNPAGVSTQLTRLGLATAREDADTRQAVQEYVDAVKAQMNTLQTP